MALIYKGPGSCEQEATTTGCSEASAEAAKRAGFEFKYVGPQDSIAAETLQKAKVWIQPGGRARIQEKVISAALKKQIVQFVQQGGGYVGFCAGGFLAYEKFGWQTPDGPYQADGLGLLSGKSMYYHFFDNEITEKAPAKIIKTSWSGKDTWVYWELGPYFVSPLSNNKDKDYEIVAKYPPHKLQQDAILSLRASYGLGKVFITAVHPEAPKDWRDYFRVSDPDGEDISLASEMIRWAARP